MNIERPIPAHYATRDPWCGGVFCSAIVIVQALIFGGTLIALHLTY